MTVRDRVFELLVRVHPCLCAAVGVLSLGLLVHLVDPVRGGDCDEWLVERDGWRLARLVEPTWSRCSGPAFASCR